MGIVNVEGLGQVHIAGDVPTPEEAQKMKAALLARQPSSPIPEDAQTPDAPSIIVGEAPFAQGIPEEFRNPVGQAPVAQEQDLGSIAAQDAAEILGVDPNIVERATLLPFGRDAQGNTQFAVPQLALEFARGVILPGQAARGVPTTERDITEGALAGFAPATKGVLATRASTRAGKLTAKQIAEAPSSVDLTKASGKKFTAARQAGGGLSPDDYVGFLAGAERDIVEEGVDAALHPKLTNVFNVLTKKIGNEMDAQDLHKIRRTINIAVDSLEPDEARIARVLRNNFDDFVEDLPGTDKWVEARNLYIKARKAETVERAINKAGSTASGLENGLRIEFRKILGDPRKIRSFSPAERKAMQAVVDGDFTTNTLKRIGKISFGSGAQSGFLGGSVGVAGGAALGGPAGAVLAPVIGFGAQKGAEKGTLRAANTLRALVAGARPEPETVLRGRGAIARPLAGAAASETIRAEDVPEGFI
jgi:hypothetical protein